MGFSVEAHEYDELRRMTRSKQVSADRARRAQVILALGNGETFAEIGARFECSPTYIATWKARFLEDRLAGLVSRYTGGPKRTLNPKLEARILDATRKAPADGSTHWSTRKLGEHLGISLGPLSSGASALTRSGGAPWL